jgi:predicted nucleic acid-binding protein
VLRSAVVDASPLIFLARTGLLDALREASETVIVPVAVVREVRARAGTDDAAVAALATMTWLRPGPEVTLPPSVASWDLGPGESETIAFAARTPDCVAVIDDRAARACAASHRVACVGTLGLLLAAKRRGRLAAVRPALDALLAAGFYVSGAVLDAVAREAGE